MVKSLELCVETAFRNCYLINEILALSFFTVIYFSISSISVYAVIASGKLIQSKPMYNEPMQKSPPSTSSLAQRDKALIMTTQNQELLQYKCVLRWELGPAKPRSS